MLGQLETVQGMLYLTGNKSLSSSNFVARYNKTYHMKYSKPLLSLPVDCSKILFESERQFGMFQFPRNYKLIFTSTAISKFTLIHTRRP